MLVLGILLFLLYFSIFRWWYRDVGEFYITTIWRMNGLTANKIEIDDLETFRLKRGMNEFVAAISPDNQITYHYNDNDLLNFLMLCDIGTIFIDCYVDVNLMGTEITNVYYSFDTSFIRLVESERTLYAVD